MSEHSVDVANLLTEVAVLVRGVFAALKRLEPQWGHGNDRYAAKFDSARSCFEVGDEPLWQLSEMAYYAGVYDSLLVELARVRDVSVTSELVSLHRSAALDDVEVSCVGDAGTVESGRCGRCRLLTRDDDARYFRRNTGWTCTACCTLVDGFHLESDLAFRRDSQREPGVSTYGTCQGCGAVRDLSHCPESGLVLCASCNRSRDVDLVPPFDGGKVVTDEQQ